MAGWKAGPSSVGSITSTSGPRDILPPHCLESSVSRFPFERSIQPVHNVQQQLNVVLRLIRIEPKERLLNTAGSKHCGFAEDSNATLPEADDGSLCHSCGRTRRGCIREYPCFRWEQ